MKHISLRFSLSLIIFILATELPAEQISVRVNGFVCSLCAQGVEKKLEAVSKQGIENYAADMETKTVMFNLKDGKSLSDKDIKKAVRKAGYAVEKITRKKGLEKKDPALKPNLKSKSKDSKNTEKAKSESAKKTIESEKS